MNSNCSLLITTYNWPQALHLCLLSVLQQTVLPSEILIADDGSGPETRMLIDAFNEYSPIPLVHVWQPDEGFRLARIRNRAIARATHPYIIQVDGDLILHPRFIEDHLQLREPGYFITGSRVLLNNATTQSLLTHQSIDVNGHHQGSKNFWNKLRNGALRDFLAKRYKTSGRNLYYIKGCNMAYWRKDMLQVNGYNEAFTSWGLEDSELAVRLINIGLNKKFLKMGGITYHLFHPLLSRDQECRNRQIVKETLVQQKTFVPAGINQYL
ncbi:N-terminal domain of galactosyltransferase [Cnuella takakiae]|uniref:N-terminal domain of galactosyltransferase n=1 Tax=Cnuella takakiae TaxID=1302690 RepID=A0A1M5GTA5_9BACT|nr:glycosyltransferase family 2 protein [Cnuella takakiae]OLY90894.1 hypothetical protein BUE76_02530 [Cnuella takakiae]SHG07006.1 N-terminal domain of galactosyltransferase [Cnuella takakiae]